MPKVILHKSKTAQLPGCATDMSWRTEGWQKSPKHSLYWRPFQVRFNDCVHFDTQTATTKSSQRQTSQPQPVSHSKQNSQGAALCYCFFPQVTSPLCHSWVFLKVAEGLGKGWQSDFKTGTGSHDIPASKSSSLAPLSVMLFQCSTSLQARSIFLEEGWGISIVSKARVPHLVGCSTNDMQIPSK